MDSYTLIKYILGSVSVNEFVRDWVKGNGVRSTCVQNA